MEYEMKECSEEEFKKFSPVGFLKMKLRLATSWRPIDTLPVEGKEGDMVVVLHKRGTPEVWVCGSGRWWACEQVSQVLVRAVPGRYTHFYKLPPVTQQEK